MLTASEVKSSKGSIIISLYYRLHKAAIIILYELYKCHRMIKPVITFSCGFYSSWFTHSDNFITVKAHEGEAQQLFELVIELPCAWQHPLIMHYKDEFGCLRSIINRHVGRNNLPYNITRDIAVAFTESSDFIYFILY